MPSKGIRCYAYIAVQGCAVKFSVPGQDVVWDQQRTFQQELLEVEKEHLGGAFKFEGRFSFTVTHDGQEVTTQWVNINALTGHMGDGTMQAIKNTPSIIHDDFIVSYGFYDAPQHDEGGLPNEDQCYVTVSPNYSEWMKELVPPGSEGIQKPFHKFVLPAVHDVGMNSLQNATAVLQYSGDDMIRMVLARYKLEADLHFGIANTAIKHIAPDIIESLAITEKDSLETMLAIGARYFEFRPAHLHDDLKPKCPIPDVLYFQHACIPGMVYADFLAGIVAFLNAHQYEIVVVQVRYDGILAGCSRPSDEELNDMVNKALEGTDLHCGSADDLQHCNIHELRAGGKRLIIMNSVSSFSTYTDEGNATLTGESIVAEFEAIDPAKQEGQVFTNLQCQATATNIRNAVIYSAISADSSNSCIMASKAVCDSKTLPWIRDHALEKLRDDQLVVVMNDFIDGATADVAIEFSRRRLAT